MPSKLVIILMFFQMSFSQNMRFDELRKQFFESYTALQIPNLQASYVQNLKSIKPVKDIEKQEAFFKTIMQQLASVNVNSLGEYQRLDYYIMDYEIGLNLERISLEKQWDYKTQLDDSKSIYSIINGKDWYAYLLKRWVNADVTPDGIFQFGLEEIEKVKAEMKTLQEQSGLINEAFKEYLNDETFFYNDVNDVTRAFKEAKAGVAKSSASIFPYTSDIAEVKISQGSNASLAHVPAYYNNGTFFFNYFDTPFNKRQIGWIYIHEGIPGHHYQSMINNIVKRTNIQDLFWYPGFVEGWGAYVEYLSKELGVYKTIYDEYGKWEWDLIRSVRVALDVGINYYGWSDDKAITFWKEHISNQDDIGWREIERMKRWPAQVITYKYGAKKFLDLLNTAKQKDTFSFMKFHSTLLKHGDIPLTILNN